MRNYLAQFILLFTILSDTTFAEFERIQVSPDGRGFACADSGRPFLPWGFNYDHDAAGRLLEDYWLQEWSTVAADFREMRDLGANVVRIHLQFGRFMQNASTPDQQQLKQLSRLLRLAEETDLKIDLTGLGCYHRKDVPAWYDQLDEAERWQAQARFWEAVAEICHRSPAVFCYDLMNEPVVTGGDQPRDDWLGPGFGDKHFVQFITLDRAGRDRADIACKWIRLLTAAIRQHDPTRLITVGLVPWSLDRPGLTSGFVPERIARELDFLAVHIYPDREQPADALQTLRGFAAAGKPVIIEETFPLRSDALTLERFLRAARFHSAGTIGFYWGTTPAELEQQKTLPAAIQASWLKSFTALKDDMQRPLPVFLQNGVTAHRGDSVRFAENTMPAFRAGIEAGADWLELDLFRTADGKLVVTHDHSTGRVAERDLSVTDSAWAELRMLDVATDFRRRTSSSLQQVPPAQMPTLDEVLQLVMQQEQTRVSIQPKMDCVEQAVQLIHSMHADPWVGFNDGNLELMTRVRELDDQIPVFWDRAANTDLTTDLRIARERKFQALVLHYSGVTAARIQAIHDAGLESGAWTVNDPQEMLRLRTLNVQRLYTDDPVQLLRLIEKSTPAQ